MINWNQDLLPVLLANDNAGVEVWTCVFYPPTKFGAKIKHNMKPCKVLAKIEPESFERVKNGTRDIINEMDIRIFSLEKKSKQIDFRFCVTKDGRGYFVHPLFDNEEECTQYYNNKVFEHIKKINAESDRLRTIALQCEELFINTDYTLELLTQTD